MADGFTIDPRLAGDTVLVAEGPLSQLRLVDDARFPWLVLVPRVPGAEEWIDLSGDQQRLLLAEINLAGRLLRGLGPVHKLNIGALGNIVRQLHVHVLARQEGDAAWPGPVWGAGQRQPYVASVRDALVSSLRHGLDTFPGP
ncbi:HIT family protein [Arenimonas sp. SCN 70-307]|uniref:HIT family protein n=1 Tax=Arenimonas sp. SCN 70-307 TaxID=1660089 RepID=UPI000B04D290|nr:HIT family protein [Arenimonas sp. SCN 70-307]